MKTESGCVAFPILLSFLSPPRNTRNSDERPKIIYIYTYTHIFVANFFVDSCSTIRKYFKIFPSFIIGYNTAILENTRFGRIRLDTILCIFLLFILFIFFFSLFFFWQTITNERSFNKRTVYSWREDWRKIRNGGGGDVEMFRN